MTLTALSILLALVTAAPQPQRPKASGLVLGRVIDVKSGRPIAGAIVSLFGSASVPSPPRASASAPRVMTNIDGQFVVRGLRKGTLFLVVTKGGYVDAMNGQRRPGGSGQPLQISDGQRITDVELRMWKYAVISGSVVDEAGEPIIGARVQAYARTFVAGRPRFTPSVAGSTDDRGMYRLAGLTPGDYRVAVTSSLVTLPTSVMDTLLQGTGDRAARRELAHDAGAIGSAVAPAGSQFAMRAGTETISLAPGTASPVPLSDGRFLVYPTTPLPAALAVQSGEERSNVDLQMQPSRSVRVAGNIIAPIGFAGHIPLRLIPIGNDELMAELETATTMSDADGAFSFPAVPPGQYVLRVIRVPRLPAGPDADEGNRTTIVRSGSVTIASSAVPNPGPMAPPPIPADSTLCADVALAVGETDLTGIMITLRTGPRMSGRVEFDGSGNRPDAMALANMRISLDPVDGSTLPEGVGFVTGRVDETGQFTTYGVPPGKYFVRVSGLSDWFFKGALYEDRDLSDTPIELGAEDVSGVVLTFTDRPSSIAGTVRTKHAADGNAVVFAFPMERAEWLGTGTAPRRMRTARANRDGSYVFPALPPGDYYVVAATEDFIEDWRDPAFLETISGSAEQVHVNEGERRTLDLLTTPIR